MRSIWSRTLALAIAAGFSLVSATEICVAGQATSTGAGDTAPKTHWIQWRTPAPKALTIHRGDTIKIWTRFPRCSNAVSYNWQGLPDSTTADELNGPVLAKNIKTKLLGHSNMELASFKAVRDGEAEITLFKNARAASGKIKVTVILTKEQAVNDAFELVKTWTHLKPEQSGFEDLSGATNLTLGKPLPEYYVGGDALRNWSAHKVNPLTLFKRLDYAATYPVFSGGKICHSFRVVRQQNGGWRVSAYSSGITSIAAEEAINNAMKENRSLKRSDFIMVSVGFGHLDLFIAYKQLSRPALENWNRLPVGSTAHLGLRRQWRMVNLFKSELFEPRQVVSPEQAFQTICNPDLHDASKSDAPG